MSAKTGTGKYERLLARCRSLAAVPTAVAYPCEESALAGASRPAQKGLIEPILVGPAATIEEIARKARHRPRAAPGSSTPRTSPAAAAQGRGAGPRRARPSC